jgi:hypothetical protein
VERRRVLAGTIALVVPASGCTRGRDERTPNPSTTSVGTDDPTATEPGGGTRTAGSREGTVGEQFPMYEPEWKTLSIGSRESVTDDENNLPHDLLVWNAATDSREIRVDVHDDADTALLTETHEMPADSTLRVELLEPGQYTASVHLAGAEDTEPITIPEHRFDCNESEHQITVAADGTVESTVYSDAQACPTDTPTNTP